MSKRDPKGYYPIPDLGENVRFVSVTTALNVLGKFNVEQWKVDVGVDCLYESTIMPYMAGDITLDQFREIDFERAMGVAKYHYKELSGEGKDLGTRFHDAMDAYHKTGAHPIDPELREAFQNTIAWENLVKVDVVESEKMVYCKTFQYAGTPDLVCDAIFNVDPVRGILDYKTYNGKKVKKPTIYPSWKQQLGAYVYAYEEMTGDLLDFGGIIAVNATTKEVSPHIFFRPELIQPTNEFIALVGYVNLCRRGK